MSHRSRTLLPCALWAVLFFLPAGGAVAQALPPIEQGLEEGTSTYAVSVAMNGQNMQMSVTQDVEEVVAGWRVTEAAEGPMGTATDVEVVAEATLSPISRRITQGPMSIDLSYSDSTVEGSILMQGNEQPVRVALDGPIFSDGAAANLIIAALPLEEGYTATYRTLDLTQQQLRTMRVEVTGTDSVSVPAGAFHTYRVEVTSAEGGAGGTIVWVDRASRLVVRAEATVPQLNNATLTTELQSSTRLSE